MVPLITCYLSLLEYLRLNGIIKNEKKQQRGGASKTRFVPAVVWCNQNLTKLKIEM